MSKNIILIDDDADTRTYMGAVLSRGGYKIQTAGNGQEGWQKIQEQKPDMILLDIMMPRKSGMNLLADLKKNPEYKNIPVLIISGVGQMTGVDMKKHMSGKPGDDAVRPDGFMEKPVKPDKLLKTVKAMLGD